MTKAAAANQRPLVTNLKSEDCICSKSANILPTNMAFCHSIRTRESSVSRLNRRRVKPMAEMTSSPNCSRSLSPIRRRTAQRAKTRTFPNHPQAKRPSLPQQVWPLTQILFYVCFSGFFLGRHIVGPSSGRTQLFFFVPSSAFIRLRSLP